MSANPARLSNSGSRALHSTALSSANGVRSNRLPHTASQTSHESRSATHASICACETRAGSSTSDARMRASCTPDAQSAAARS